MTQLAFILDEIVKILGIKSPVSEQVPYVAEAMRSSYGSLTINEVREAFMLLVAGKLNMEPMRIFDSMFICGVLSAYTDYKRQSVMLDARSQKQKELEVPRLPPANFILDFIIQDEEFVRAGGNINEVMDLGGVKYDELSKLGHLNLDPQKKWELFESALVEIYQQESVMPLNKTPSQRNAENDLWNKILEQIEAKKYNPNNLFHGRAVAKAKLASYREYIKNKANDKRTIDTDKLG